MNDMTPTEVLKNTDRQTAVDARGRVIAVERLNALSYYRLTKLLGASANNNATLDIAVIAAAVRRIDTLDLAMPTKESDLHYVIQTLDFDGLGAAGEALKKFAATGDDDEIETAKN